MKVKIIVNGCDDSTEIVLKNVDEDELDFLRELSDLITEASKYSCQPTFDLIEDYEEVEE